MTGTEYANLVAEYLKRRFASRAAKVYREVSLGKSIIGKNRRIDILLVTETGSVAIECKYQNVQGTVDEKIPYALDDMLALPMHGVVAYAGDGFSSGVVHMLQASEIAAYCLPAEDQDVMTADTRELDHQVAMRLGWWDILVGDKRPI